MGNEGFHSGGAFFVCRLKRGSEFRDWVRNKESFEKSDKAGWVLCTRLYLSLTPLGSETDIPEDDCLGVLPRPDLACERGFQNENRSNTSKCLTSYNKQFLILWS